jgi:guanylate kinase
MSESVAYTQSEDDLVFLDSLRQFTEDYQPSTRVLGKIASHNLVIADGVSSAGKGTHLDFLFQHAHDLGLKELHRVLSFTTRPPRPSELEGKDPYEAHLNVGDPLIRKELLAILKRRGLVQAISHPSGDIYGTRVKAYTGPPSRNIAEFTAAEAKRLKEEGIFPGLEQVVCIVPVNGETWLRRWFARDGNEPDKYDKRLMESFESLEIGLNAVSHETVFVTNAYGENEEIPAAYLSMAAVLRGDYDTNLAAASRERAQEMHAFIGSLLTDFVDIPGNITE